MTKRMYGSKPFTGSLQGSGKKLLRIHVSSGGCCLLLILILHSQLRLRHHLSLSVLHNLHNMMDDEASKSIERVRLRCNLCLGFWYWNNTHELCHPLYFFCFFLALLFLKTQHIKVSWTEPLCSDNENRSWSCNSLFSKNSNTNSIIYDISHFTSTIPTTITLGCVTQIGVLYLELKLYNLLIYAMCKVGKWMAVWALQIGKVG